jgi:segregation and condensation protein A
MSSYTIDLPIFSGPLDLLLHLIDRQELDITAVSLAQVTAQYLAQIEQLKQNRLENLIDFLVIGARLTVIKSRALLPETLTFAGDEEEEEDPAEALIRQLKQYKRFKQAAAWLGAREEKGWRTYLRVAPPPRVEKQLDLSGVTPHTLYTAVLDVLSQLSDREDSVSLVQPSRITIEQQIGRLRYRLKQQRPFLFYDLLSPRRDRTELAVTLLALLELIKRQEASAHQPTMFGPIEIRAIVVGE